MAAELEQILSTAMARNPADRYASAAKLGQALRGHRYSLTASGADPAKELARVIHRFAPAPERSSVEREPTVVRIQTAAGFTVTGLDTFTGSGELTGSREPFGDGDGDDDEQTHALSPNELRRIATPVTPSTPGELMFDDPPLRELVSDSPPPGPASATATPPRPLVAPRQPERAATPTVRDVFGGDLIDTEPSPKVDAVTRPRRRLLSDGEQLASRPRRRRIILLVAAAFAVAVGSFLVAGMLLRGDDSSAAAPSPPDAAPVIVDAGVPDAAKKKLKPKPKPRPKKPRPKPKPRPNPR
jgi:hypothetical protein